MTDNQVVSTMFNIKSSIHMDRIIQFRDWDEDPGLGTHFVMCFSLLINGLLNMKSCYHPFKSTHTINGDHDML